jgi:peptidoglycan/LPS O-acetylase OafA/YrhL
LTPSNKITSLEVLRGLACLIVWVGHLRIATGYYNGHRFDFIQLFTAWGREAVIIFFVLSGIVINISSKHIGRAGYFKKRFLRIYPIFFVVLIFCFALDKYIFGHPTDVHTFLGNLFLSGLHEGFISDTMPLNPAVWSITCEVFFYIVFGILLTNNRRTGIWIWFGISVLSIVCKMIFGQFHSGYLDQLVYLLNYSFLWLAGYLIFEYRTQLTTNFPTAMLGILMIPLATRMQRLPDFVNEFNYVLVGLYLAPLFIFLLQDRSSMPKKSFNIHYLYLFAIYLINCLLLWQFSDSVAFNKLLYLLFPLLSLGFYYKVLLRLCLVAFNKISFIFTFIAGISYPLYLIHMPVMYFVFHIFPHPHQRWVGVPIIVVSALGISYFLEIMLFRKLASMLNQKQRIQLIKAS